MSKRDSSSQKKKVNDFLITIEEQLEKSEEMIELFNNTALKKGFNPEGLPINMDNFPIEVRVKLKSLYSQLYPQKMNIFALNNDKVIYMGNERGGTDKDKNNAELYLKRGQVYTIKTTFANDCFSYVVLKEFSKTLFNGMYFMNSCDFVN